MRSGQISLIRFPQTDLAVGKLRPVLVLRRLPGKHKDWLICMISSQLRHQVEELDEIIQADEPDFISSGLKVTSLIRVGRLAVVDESLLLGSIGELSEVRVQKIKHRLGRWLAS